MKTKIINIGILAHVDAGKTTITEQILYQSGALRSIGSVDKGTAVTDSLKVEKERGISVRLATASFEHKGIKVNIIDTPGHVDFCAEVEYSLRALDAVILVISAVEGVQGHTLSLFQAIKQLKIPCLIFVNKIDRIGADTANVMTEIGRYLSKKNVLLQQAQNEGQKNASLKPLWTNKIQTETIIEQLIEYDDLLMEDYLEGIPLDFTLLENLLKNNIASFNTLPVIMGVAKNGLGIIELMDCIINYLPASSGDKNKPLSALVFKVEHHKTHGKLAYFRLFDGTIKSRDSMHNASRKLEKNQKATQLKTIVTGKYTDVEQLNAGDIGIVAGLSHAKAGDIYGTAENIPSNFSLSTALLSVQVKPKDSSQIMPLVQALTQLSDEDPTLDLDWQVELRELHIKISGMIQIEILQAILQDIFNLSTDFSPPTIIYKETPATIGYGYERYWMPKPCWAILKLKIEPAKLGSGISYTSQVSVNDVAAKYQKEIEQTIDKALRQGIKGWQVTDIKITLIEGQDHNIHSRSGDFIIATPMAILNGLKETGTILLEPILSFIISASTDLLGAISSDITKMRGTYESPQIIKDTFTLHGTVPASTAMQYPIKLASLSTGKAKISTKFDAYLPCSEQQGKSTHYRGVSPLDRDKWILQARGAL